MSETNQNTTSQSQTAAPAEQPREWNAGEWVRDAFKDDPSFKDLSPADVTRLEEIADQAHDRTFEAAQGWVDDFQEKWSKEIPERVQEGLGSNAETQSWLEAAAADGKIDEAEQANLKEIVGAMDTAEQMGVARPIVEGMKEMADDGIDGVEVIVDTAIDGGLDVYEARGEMPGGDNDVNQEKIVKLTEAKEELDHVFEFEREQVNYQWSKAEEQMDLIEAGTDIQDLPPDRDTYQADENAAEYETAEA